MNSMRHIQWDCITNELQVRCIFLNENVWILIKISPKFVPDGPINNITALIQIMARRRWGEKPLSEPMMVSLPMHICDTRPQWVKSDFWFPNGYTTSNQMPGSNLFFKQTWILTWNVFKGTDTAGMISDRNSSQSLEIHHSPSVPISI